MSIDELEAILNKDNFDQTKKAFIGPYFLDDGEYFIEVYDEKKEMIWSHYSDDDGSWEYDSDLKVEIDECSDLYCEFYADDVLVAEVQCKGIFKEFTLDLIDVFDPNLLTPKIMEVVQRFTLITDLFYNKEKLEYEDCDPEQKGVCFYLSDKMPYS
jgi:hypothetical protein